MLEIDGIGVSFGGVRALRGVSFSAAAKDITSVVGPNGAGKTTLFNIVTGFQRAEAGTVAFDGKSVTGWRPNRIAVAGLVRTFQKTEVFGGLTVARAVEIGTTCGRPFPLWRTLVPGATKRAREEAEHEAALVLAQCGLSDRADQPCVALSYGEQRLLEVALALAARPRMILLDEPASGLNPTEARQLGELIARLRDDGIGIVLIEHNMQLVMRISDRIVVLHHGEKIAEGKPDAIQKDARVIDAYLGGGIRA
ncbi:MAG: ABC transporter ATP-binding protein [Methylobacteriaceae bacterium]|nr:ABC transporter ATP-binding protein [Methylobacteriaceae bacterium]